jgi:hypothetical protein
MARAVANCSGKTTDPAPIFFHAVTWISCGTHDLRWKCGGTLAHKTSCGNHHAELDKLWVPLSKPPLAITTLSLISCGSRMAQVNPILKLSRGLSHWGNSFAYRRRMWAIRSNDVAYELIPCKDVACGLSTPSLFPNPHHMVSNQNAQTIQEPIYGAMVTIQESKHLKRNTRSGRQEQSKDAWKKRRSIGQHNPIWCYASLSTGTTRCEATNICISCLRSVPRFPCELN